ncbi:MAG: helix-hairpin-helix domain-containing protein [Lachnospiraceae bacterium]|nr:helix-hairpin-helix domain-containing protein [Lachnospiraceae bacterium]
MKNNLVNKVFVKVVIIVTMVCFSACGKGKKENVFLSETQDVSESKTVTDNRSDVEEVENINLYETLDNVELDETLSKIIYVQVNGAVNNPGVYKIEKEMRVFEVIELAGGVTTNGATETINMARPVTDEMVIYIPTKEEVIQGFSDETETVFEDYELDNEKSPVNINTASIDELVTLSGIGETKARQIIEYREEHGDFKDISEIMNISGIKQSAFEKIKDYITV